MDLERSTGHGDIHSHFNWLAVFNVGLIVLKRQRPSARQFQMCRSDSFYYPIFSLFPLLGLQFTPDLVSVFAIWSCWSDRYHPGTSLHFFPPLDDPGLFQTHFAGRLLHNVPIRSTSTFKSLGERCIQTTITTLPPIRPCSRSSSSPFDRYPYLGLETAGRGASTAFPQLSRKSS